VAAVTDEFISIENAVITILGLRAQNGGLDYFSFLCLYSGRRDTRFEILSAIISPQDFPLWCKNLSIKNALRGLKLG